MHNSPLHRGPRDGAGVAKRAGIGLIAAGLALATATAGISLISRANEPSRNVVAYTAANPSDYKAQAAGLDAGLKKAISRDLGISAERYLSLADSGQAAADTVKSLGNGVKASWIDNDGTLHVIAADATTAHLAEQAGAQASQNDPLGDKASAESASHPDRTYYVDRQAGEVKSYAKNSLNTMSGLADGELIGGTGYMITESAGTARCSAGFAGTDGFGQPVDLTAGHCVGSVNRTVQAQAIDLPAPTAYLDRQAGSVDLRNAIGRTASGYIGQNNDAGIINLSDGTYQAIPYVSTWGAGDEAAENGTTGEGNFSQDTGTPLAVYDAADVIVGMPACKSGSTSGWTCGVITNTDVSETIGDGNGGVAGDVYGFQFSACMMSGDSGGAIVSGHYAIGVDSYGNMSSCADASDPDAVSGGFAVVSGDYNAENMFGDHFNLAIVVGTPKFDALSDGTAISSSDAAAKAISGTVDAATGATVNVTVDGRQYTTKVTNGGKWSVTLDSALSAGSHTVAASASHTPRGSSLTTTGGTATVTFTVA